MLGREKIKLNRSKRVLILDSTAFYAGIPFTSTSTYYTTSSVIQEVKHTRTSKTAIESLIEAGRLIVKDPSAESIERVKDLANISGDIGKLSQTDLEVIALAYELKGKDFDAIIVSDDYSIENLARILHIDSIPIITKGISNVVKWLVYCSGCGKVFEDKKAVICDVCGTKLRRRFGKSECIER
ncbi:MAG: nucleotide-binding protein [Nitrososphaerota archaeon]|nr:hypothetical protein [Nitrososphaerales archaeon]MDW8045163.1 nucleotide-binding protein [Nitrososphaerota archaeon]